MPSKQVNYGQYAFLGGLAIALILGVLSSFVPAGIMPALYGLLFVLGIAVGLLNISEKEVKTFLIATIALLMSASAFGNALSMTLSALGDIGTTIGGMIVGFTAALIAFISPAAFIVAILAVYRMAQPD